MSNVDFIYAFQTEGGEALVLLWSQPWSNMGQIGSDVMAPPTAPALGGPLGSHSTQKSPPYLLQIVCHKHEIRTAEAQLSDDQQEAHNVPGKEEDSKGKESLFTMGFISKAIVSDDCISRDFSPSEEADSMAGLIPINSGFRLCSVF